MSLPKRVAPARKKTVPSLDHGLAPYFARLSRFNSTRAMKSSPLWVKVEPELRRVMETVVPENHAVSQPEPDRSLRAISWNIERGTQLEGILEVLSSHERAIDADVLLLTELDFGMARSGNRFIARDIARELALNFAFANCYVSLVKGSGLEYHIEGENSLALHGNALFSRFPIEQAHAIALPNGKDKMRGKEKRLGWQQAVAGLIRHPKTPFWAVSLHLDAHSSQSHRYRQMGLVLDHMDRLSPRLPILIGGDWNTSTYNSKRATYSILGYVRRVLMGVNNVIKNHYPHPDRWFERRLFRELEDRGYEYRRLNELGVGTLHYSVDDVAVNTNMGDWVPQWCFWFIQWALKHVGGKCSLKLDWFAGRGIQPEPTSPPRVLGEVHDRENPLSDHDPIALDFFVQPTARS